MNKNYRVDITDGITTVCYSKAPGMDDIRSSIDEAAAINRSGLRLWNFSSGSLNLSSAQLQELSEYAQSKFLPPSKVAIVASEDLAFGLSRVYEVFREQEQVELEIFRIEQEAIDWLKKEI